MQIGELARRTGISVSRIRFYEARGLLAKAPRADNGYRSYGPDAATTLAFVDQAQRLGFSLAEIRDAVPGPDATMPSPSIIVAALRQKATEIDRLIEAAIVKRQAIASLLDELGCAA